MLDRKSYAIASIYDTETTNLGNTSIDARAFCVCYIFNDIRNKKILEYVPFEDDKVSFYRTEIEALNFIDELIAWGIEKNVIPIICAYNLMFDMQTLMLDLNGKYAMGVSAQSSTNVYTLDLLDDDGKQLLRFWDTFHLEMRGLSAMGETCGLGKLDSWDYSLIRTSETELTEKELNYAARDVQVIPAYLSYLLAANSWLEQDMLGSIVLTKTSLVRQMAANDIGRKWIKKRNGKNTSLLWAFEKTCKNELPNTFRQYALRKACFRGGFTFTSALAANSLVENVVSLDVTSMHHAFINGRMIPEHFRLCDDLQLMTLIAKQVVNTTTDEVLENYDKPFNVAFHYHIEFRNIRLKKNSCFDRWKIALIPAGKFGNEIPKTDIGLNERDRMQEKYLRLKGWHDEAINGIFAFSKLYSADIARLYVTELELWCISRVYEFDDLSVLFGEHTSKFALPPDYVTLQSNILFNMKNDAKRINNEYIEGTPYINEIPETIPKGISEQLKNGTCSKQFFESYYTSTVKGMFNGIYGTMAQDVFKPDYAVEEGELYVDEESKTTESNYEEKKPSKCKVHYNYGMRIVGGSRMHLIIAIELLYAAFGDRCFITGGDTDSIKMQIANGIEPNFITEALKVLHKAVRQSIYKTSKRIRKLFSNYVSGLKGVGEFEIEKCDGFEMWKYHFEAWNKARISISQTNEVHITCAGLSRPRGFYTIENFIYDLTDGKSKDEIEKILQNILGYNINVPYELCFSLEHSKPNVDENIDEIITDYKGNSYRVNQRKAIALYASGRVLGDTNKKTNLQNISFLRSLGKYVEDGERFLIIDSNRVAIEDVNGVLYESQI